MRPVINLKPLNVYLRKQHFKMDTLTKVINMVEKGDWAISIDLKDAYHHIMIFKGHRKFWRFQGMTYQFCSLCFGPTSAPRTFVKVIAVIVTHLRKNGLRLASYIDDWLNLNKLKQDLMENRFVAQSLLSTRFNDKQRKIPPSSCAGYNLSGNFIQFKERPRLSNTRAYLQSEESCTRIIEGKHYSQAISSCVGNNCIMSGVNSKLETVYETSSTPFVTKLEPCTSTVFIPNCSYVTSSSSSEMVVRYSGHFQGHIFSQTGFSLTLTTDASGKWGWGGHMNNLTCQGQWSLMEKMLHINCLEMKAVKKCLQHFQLHIQNQNVFIRSDNTTVCQYINRQGGMKSTQLCNLTMGL